MRGIITRALAALCALGAVGCVLTSGELHPPDKIDTNREAALTTAAYWKQVREISLARSKSDDMRELAEAVRKQMDGIRAIPSEGVDAELVTHAEAVAACHERLLTVVETAGYAVAGLKQSSEARRSFMEAGRQTGEAQVRLKGLRPTLAARYGTDFPPLDR